MQNFLFFTKEAQESSSKAETRTIVDQVGLDPAIISAAENSMLIKVVPEISKTGGGKNRKYPGREKARLNDYPPLQRHDPADSWHKNLG